VSLKSKCAAEDTALIVLGDALAAYRDDDEHLERFEFGDYSPVAEASVVGKLEKLLKAIKEPRRCERETMLTAYAFARLAALRTGKRLVALLVSCRAIHDHTGKIERSVDTAPLFAILRKPGFWSGELQARLEALNAERREALIAADMPHGRRQALAAFFCRLKSFGPCRPADLERVARLAGLIPRGYRIRTLQRSRRGR
jgi:hypothetical protein